VYKQFLIGLLISFFAFRADSQGINEHVIDSLFYEWENNNNDTLRLHSLIALIKHFKRNQQIDSAYNMALLSKNFAAVNGYKRLEANSYELLGEFSYIKSNYDSALRYDLLSLKIYTELNDSTGIAKSLNSIGEDYLEREFYSMAYDYYYKAYTTAQNIQDSLMIAISTYNMGRVLKEQGDYEQALNYINKALDVSNSIGDEEGIAYANFDTGDIYMKLGKYEEALEKLNSALEISHTLSSYILIPQIYNQKGELYEAQGNYNQAIENYQEALNYHLRMNNKQGTGISYRGLGSVYSEKGDYGKAEEYFKECLSIANEVRSMDLKSSCYLELSQLFEKKGQAKPAFGYFKLYKSAQDTLYSTTKSEQLAQLQIEHLTQQRDLEIELLKQREAQQGVQMKQDELIRNVLVVIVAFFTVLLITLYRSSSRRKKMNNLLIKQQHELEQQRTELVELNKVKDKFFSIISHDLRSPINNLAGMSSLLTSGNLTWEETKALSSSIQKQLKHASKLLDNLLDWVLLQSNEIKIRKEVINLRQLVSDNLESFNDLNEKDLQLINEVDDIKVLADRNMIDLILRNLISNAIKFTDKGGYVTISNSTTNGKVIVSVTDTGIGVPKEVKQDLFDFKAHYSRKGTANEKGTGLGLKLCKEFVERNGGEIWVESEEGKGSSFKFTLQKAEIKVVSQ
jgi:signal transduction histidine kinase